MKFINLFAAITIASCTAETKSKTFYEQIAGWDIVHIPIIEPYRASSIDNGRTWLLNKVVDGFGGLEVISLGVSQNMIYGCSSSNNWFLFDTNSKILAEYPSQAALMASLNYLNIPIEPIASCSSYSAILAAGQPCYWFPKDLSVYPQYPPIKPKEVATLNIVEENKSNPIFSINTNIKSNTSRIYFFRINYNRPKNDIYYIAFNYSPPTLIKNNLLIPVFIPADTCQVWVYTPFPIAQQKGIAESARFVKSMTVRIQR